jgi:hypothetical protein
MDPNFTDKNVLRILIFRINVLSFDYKYQFKLFIFMITIYSNFLIQVSVPILALVFRVNVYDSL